MNINTILQKLSENVVDQPGAFNTPQQHERLTTIESFGTLANSCDQQSFTANSNHRQNRHEPFQARYQPSQNRHEPGHKISQIEHDIEKMKNLYESRKNQSHHKSIDKSSAGRSAEKHEKHLLKPSNTPSFNKFILDANSIQAVERSMQEEYHHTEVSSPSRNHKRYNYADNAQHDSYDQVSMDDYGEEISNKSASRASKSMRKKHSHPSRVHHVHIEPHETPENQQPYENHENELWQFQSEVHHKLHSMSTRLGKVQQDNQLLKEQSQQIYELNQHYREKIDNLEKENMQLNETTERWKAEKEELETILKDVLFKREREKLHTTKENKVYDNSIQSGKLKSAEGTSSHSKMKVQNLLQKLQIKVEKP